MTVATSTDDRTVRRRSAAAPVDVPALLDHRCTLAAPAVAAR